MADAPTRADRSPGRHDERVADDGYRQLFEHSPQPAWVFDRETLRFLAVNDAMTRSYGWSREELLGGLTLRDIRPAAEVPRLMAHLDELGAAGPHGEGERWRHRRRDGSLFEVELFAHPLTFRGRPARLVQVFDVTERERTESELRRQRELSEALIRSSLDGIAIVDTAGRIQLWSPAMERLTGRAASACIGRPAAEVMAELGLGDEAVAVRRALAGGQVVGERRRLRAATDAAERVLEAHFAPLRGSAGEIRGALVSVRDVTRQVQLEEQLLQAQKIEAVGQLAGGVAHDFNNLLTAILGYCELAELCVGAESEVASDLAEIRHGAERAAALTRQLLAFSRKQVLQPQVIDANAEMCELEPMLRRLLGENVQLVTLLSPAVGRIKADRGQLQQVLVNLLVNARDAMPQGGRVVVETRNATLDDAYTRVHPGSRPGAYVMIAVSDTGIGMDAAVRSRIFEPFFTTKERGKGTGLGLSMVYGVVKQSGGYIWVYSEPGHGTTFKIYFPRVDAPVDEPRERAPAADSVTGDEIILVAEDEEVVRALLARVLALQGYRVVLAESGGAALAAAEREVQIHLLLTDVVMPDMSGRDLAERLRERRPAVRVLYISGYTDESIASHGILEPGIRLLEKPFTAEVLARRVRQILDGQE